MAPAEGTKAAVSRIEELRRVLAATPDAIARARLRVELSGLLRARSDPFAALSELRRAAHEAPQLPGVRLALLSAAAELAPGERAMLLAEHARADKGPVAIWAHAAAAARAENGAVEEATRAFLEIAVDGRVPAHRRRAAARRALALADASPRQQVAALRAQAALAGGRNRLALLRRAATLAERAGDAPALLAVAGDWLVAGGPADGAVAWLGRARGAGATPVALAALESEIARRAPAPPPAPAVVTAAAPLRRSGPPPSPLALLAEAALAARAGRPRTARRRAEQALRLDQTAVDLAPAVDAVVVALQQAGAVRDALAVRRTFLESAPAEARAAGVLALAQAAADAGLDDLAAAYRTDLAPPSPSPSPSPSAAISEDRAPASRAGSFLAAQRRLARLSPGASVEPVLALLENAVSGHAAADDALALGEKLLAAGFPDGEARRVDLLRAANGTETDPTRRARLAERLAEALEQRRDRVGAVAVLEAALETLPAGMGASLRQRRARLLRDFGRPKDLAAALQGDIAALDDDERRDAFAERAVLLEAAGDPEGALEVRLAALIENPGDLPLLREARRRLDETGRWELSLRLASSAVAHLPAPAERLPLLRDIARLSEAAAHNLADAAKAWLEVARLDPTDVAAADAAERLLTALGDWDRCAALLAWQAARPPAAGSPSDGAAEVRRAGLLWRLAELRRTHLGQEEEATRLYRLLDD
ncbi:MAG TPA: hypothetical protein VMU50_15470, partial [Polyangia bacterium]|nr:hypothetical protein [Polyangia bacterium]